MNIIKLLFLVTVLSACSGIVGYDDSRSIIDQEIRGDCASVMQEYQKALIERSNLAKEMDYANYSMGRYGSANEDIKMLSIKYEKANSDVIHYEQEVLPLACSGAKYR